MDRTAVVTGGSSGLGFALARGLGAKGIGVSILGREAGRLGDAVERLRDTGADVRGVACDVSREDQVREALEDVAARGPLGYLFNVAGIGRFGPVEETTAAMIEEVMAGNFKGLMLVTATALPMLRSAGGTVVSVLSSAALVGRPDEAVYCAAKWGARGFMEALRAALIRSPVRTLTVYPGGMRTSFWSERSKRPSELDSYMDPEDVARQILRVALDSRSAHVTEMTIARP